MNYSKIIITKERKFYGVIGLATHFKVLTRIFSFITKGVFLFSGDAFLFKSSKNVRTDALISLFSRRFKNKKEMVSIIESGFCTFFFGFGETEDPSNGSAEENRVKNIASLLKVDSLEGLEIEKVKWTRGDPLPIKK